MATSVYVEFLSHADLVLFHPPSSSPLATAMLATLDIPCYESRKRKRSVGDSDFAMSSYFPLSHSFLQPPAAPSRKPSQRLMRPENELDDFLSSELEISFASTMSLNSPPGSPERNIFEEPQLAPVGVTSPVMMDISPAPPKVFTAQSSGEKKFRPRASTFSRIFGRDVSNNEASSPTILSVSSVKTTKGLQRSALPTEWIKSTSEEEFVSNIFIETNYFNNAISEI